MPDIDSKKESINVMPLNTNGIDPAEDNTTQNRCYYQEIHPCGSYPQHYLLDINHPMNPSCKNYQKCCYTKTDMSSILIY
jgi:hypothetical protein